MCHDDEYTSPEIILNIISKDRMAQIYSVKYIRSLDLPKPTVAREYCQMV